MTTEILIVLCVVGVGAVLFMIDRLPPDVVALGLMLTLLFCGILTPDEAFRGFGSDTVLLFAGLLIGTAALMRTGIVDAVGSLLTKHFSTRPNMLLLLIMVAVATLSAFLSNTATAALFLPIVLTVSKKASLSPSKYLLPMAFCSILTSSVSLISTSTNIVVSGAMTHYGMPPMGMFEMAPVGIPISIIGLLYMWFFGPMLLPDRSPAASTDEDFGLRPYLSDLIILADSPLIGKTLGESGLWNGSEVNVLRIVRRGNFIMPRGYTRLAAEDVLLVEAETEQLLKIKDMVGVDIKADAKLHDPSVDPAELRIVEALIGSDSPLMRKTLKSIHFRDRFGVQVLALTRAGAQIRAKLSEIQLRSGDILLLQAPAENLKLLETSAAIQILGAVRSNRLNPSKARWVIAFFLLAVLVTGIGAVKPAIAFVGAAVGMFVTRCIEPREAYKSIDWTLIVMVGAIFSVGLAMDKSGAASYLANILTAHAGHLSPRMILLGFLALTVILTQLMSNQAAAIVILPIAVQTAVTMQLSPRTFAMMIAVGASCSFLTPLEPACLMVYGPGGYKFSDFPKVGTLLTLLIMIIAVLLVPVVWPLH